MRYHFMLTRIASKKIHPLQNKTKQKTSVGEVVERLEPTLLEVHNGAAAQEDILVVPQQVKQNMTQQFFS